MYKYIYLYNQKDVKIKSVFHIYILLHAYNIYFNWIILAPIY